VAPDWPSDARSTERRRLAQRTAVVLVEHKGTGRHPFVYPDLGVTWSMQAVNLLGDGAPPCPALSAVALFSCCQSLVPAFSTTELLSEIHVHSAGAEQTSCHSRIRTAHRGRSLRARLASSDATAERRHPVVASATAEPGPRVPTAQLCGARGQTTKPSLPSPLPSRPDWRLSLTEAAERSRSAAVVLPR
jgi:hypothetical protein